MAALQPAEPVDDVLRLIYEGAASETGDAFFSALVRATFLAMRAPGLRVGIFRFPGACLNHRLLGGRRFRRVPRIRTDSTISTSSTAACCRARVAPTRR